MTESLIHAGANVSYDGCTFKSLSSYFDGAVGWKSGAILKAFTDCSSFEMSFKNLESPSSFEIIFGIICTEKGIPDVLKSGAPWEQDAAYGFHVFFDGSDQARLTNLGGGIAKTIDYLPTLTRRHTLRMKYRPPERRISLAVGTSPFHDITGFNIADKQYLPFIKVTHVMEMEVKIKTCRKRGSSAMSHMQRLWGEKQFADATIQTASGTISVHRAILCAVPQFAAALDGDFHESQTRKICIDDVSHAAVEAFMHFLYLGELPSDVDFADVLVLAHRYEQADLLKICAESSLECAQADANKLVRVAKRLRLFKDNASVSVAWKELVGRVMESREVAESFVMMAATSHGNNETAE
mmetsp:Transcript_4330/g.8641  ORF Transcript_4330/g.8641 Transcript_4330/m.8641 type:complete len:354 (+) Transcript_4330:132-1193(+)|eukprot:CAMPEP_0172735310 /NCGR_PEP_ID=MMETSP1074-20121228/112219_1 /TAXON_ID=2916 /ORGANISM="Ceratium fusus, Strain PA161109" /LENGTH=353 /DNA_ID=CAMNT_0013564283 /DNA_START=52 /DNA_END=1113 /DNA_ORIENTATION=-